MDGKGDAMKKLSDKQIIIRDASFFSGSIYIAQTMFFLRGFLNAKILGPSLYGLWSALNIILNYSLFMHLGSLNAMNREIPYCKGRSSSADISNVRNATFTFSLTLNLIFSIVLIVITSILWNRLSLNKAIGLIAVAFLSIVSSLYQFYQTSLIANKKFLIISRVNAMFPILSVALTLILVTRFNVYGVYMTAFLIPFLSLLYMWTRKPYKISLSFNFKEISRLIKIGFPIMTIDFLEDTVISIGGLTVLFLLGQTNLGYYSVAMLASRFLKYLPSSIDRIFEPHIYQKYGETHNILHLKKYLFKPTLVMTLLFPMVLAIYYTVASFFIRHFLSKYTVSIYPFFIILLAIFFLCFSPTSLTFITAINKQKFIVPVYLSGIIILVISSLNFINMGFGLISVAFGFLLASFFIGSVIFTYAISHYIKDVFRCVLCLVRSFLPIVYIATIVILGEIIISSSPDLFSDIVKLVIKLGGILVFSLPLIYIANSKTGIVSDAFNFLRRRFVFKKSPAYA